MSQFLLEIFSEEIPARFQKRASEDLAKMVKDGLEKAGVTVGEITNFVAPRRLGLCIENLPNETPDVKEEKKGPKVGAPQPAIDGFIRAAGISSIDEAKVVSDPKKGDFYVVEIVKNGAKTTDIIKELVPSIVRNFPWQKSMRWGEGTLRWVRPLHSILCMFNGEIVDFEIDGIKSGNVTRGHRFHAPEDFTVTDFADYQAKTRAAHVLIDREERKQSIMAQAQKLCADNGLELIEDIGLLEEVCGLVDEPFVILGQMDEAFLDLPPEVIRLTLRINQKYFVVNSKATGKLAPYFIVVSNVNATDGGKAIAHGNARVLAARLNDARYFWDLDRKTTLEARVPKLDTIVFHQKIGSIGDKVKRVVELAGEIAPIVGADVELAKRAALLCKADLVTEMVGEFPELQGVMGRYYANNDQETADVANAIAEHYKPVGPSDYAPTNPVSIAVALADKFDSLVSFFAIGEKPTGSGDPYALRRAALGIIRIILENKVRMPLTSQVNEELQSFFLDRLKVFLKDEGLEYDVIDAVFAGSDDDIYRITQKVKTLSEFLKTEEGKTLLEGYKRASNILKAEEKKGALDGTFVASAQYLELNAEKALFSAIDTTKAALATSLENEDYVGAMKTFTLLRDPIFDFLDNVLVNDSDENKRKNRLALLCDLRQMMSQVADFECIRG